MEKVLWTRAPLRSWAIFIWNKIQGTDFLKLNLAWKECQHNSERRPESVIRRWNFHLRLVFYKLWSLDRLFQRLVFSLRNLVCLQQLSFLYVPVRTATSFSHPTKVVTKKRRFRLNPNFRLMLLESILSLFFQGVLSICSKLNNRGVHCQIKKKHSCEVQLFPFLLWDNYVLRRGSCFFQLLKNTGGCAKASSTDAAKFHLWYPSTEWRASHAPMYSRSKPDFIALRGSPPYSKSLRKG